MNKLASARSKRVAITQFHSQNLALSGHPLQRFWMYLQKVRYDVTFQKRFRWRSGSVCSYFMILTHTVSVRRTGLSMKTATTFRLPKLSQLYRVWGCRAFDSNAASNQKVQQARPALARDLQSRGAQVQ
jgi:hypothetical protein